MKATKGDNCIISVKLIFKSDLFLKFFHYINNTYCFQIIVHYTIDLYKKTFSYTVIISQYKEIIELFLIKFLSFLKKIFKICLIYYSSNFENLINILITKLTCITLNRLNTLLLYHCTEKFT